MIAKYHAFQGSESSPKMVILNWAKSDLYSFLKLFRTPCIAKVFLIVEIQAVLSTVQGRSIAKKAEKVVNFFD